VGRRRLPRGHPDAGVSLPPSLPSLHHDRPTAWPRARLRRGAADRPAAATGTQAWEQWGLEVLLGFGRIVALYYG
jgi:hypothetical protein